MKTEILQENLARAVSTTAGIISSSPQLPILGNIFIKAQKTGLLFIGTNLETTISFFVPAKVKEEGEITVPAKTLVELVTTLRPGKIQLSRKGNEVLVSHKEGEIRLSSLSADDFPIKSLTLDKKKKPKKIILPGGELLSLLKRVVFAAATDSSRPVLSGVLFKKDKQRLSLVATDGYRLSLAKNDKPLKGALKKDIVVPVGALRELEKSLTTDGDVEFFLNREGTQVFFSQNNFILGARLVEGEFPDFAKIIPSSQQAEVVVDREEMISALKTMAIFARESANIVCLKTGKDLTLMARAVQVGEGDFKLKNAQVKGEEMTIAFNFRFLLDGLGAFGKERVVMAFSSSLAPVKFTSQKDTSFLHIVMPIRLQDN